LNCFVELIAQSESSEFEIHKNGVDRERQGAKVELVKGDRVELRDTAEGARESVLLLGEQLEVGGGQGFRMTSD